MRIGILSLSLFLAFSLSFIGCDENNSSNEPRAHTEIDFVADPDLRADPDDKVIFVNLESQMSEPSENQTGELGFDVIPFNYTRAVNQTICWEDPSQESEHSMTLFDSEGAQILTLLANGPCETVTIEPGPHEMHLFHDNSASTILPIFIDPNVLDAEVASGGIINKALKFLSLLDTSNFSMAQSPTPSPAELANVTKFVNTGGCQGCDLRNTLITYGGGDCATNPDALNLDLEGADLTGASVEGLCGLDGVFVDTIFQNGTLIDGEYLGSMFDGANFMGATIMGTSSDFRIVFTGADMKGVKFNGAHIENVLFETTTMSERTVTNQGLTTEVSTEFGSATVENATFTGTTFEKVGFQGATFTNCDFSGVDLSQSNTFITTTFSGSNLNSVNLSNVSMLDANFENSTLMNADLSGLNCIVCNFMGANLTGANLQGASFDATGAILSETECVCTNPDCTNCP